MSVCDELVAAFERSDEFTVRRLGWSAVYEAASTWWLPRQSLSMPAFAHYAKALAGEDPEVVLAAFRDTAGEWRPTVGAVMGAIKRKRGEGKRMDVGRSRDRAKAPDALAAVARAIRGGEHPCGCDRRGSTWHLDAAGVVRCPACRGIEQGQVYAMQDLERPEVAA